MDFQQKIAGMRPGYLARTERRLKDLREAIGAGSDERGALLTALHDLAGTAPVMGLEEIGAAGRQLEAQLTSLPEDVDAAAELDLILAQLHEAKLQCG